MAELADATGLSYGQVEQVVQRLVDSGYVHPLECTEPDAVPKKRVGRPRIRYTLTEDPVRREKFRADVASISAAERRSFAQHRRPSTAHYSRAMQTIETAEQGMPFTAKDLDQAEELLLYGRDFEGLIPEGADIVAAYYDLAAFRLEALRGDYAKAEGILARAKEAFQAADLPEEVERVADLALSLRVETGLTEIASRIDSPFDSQKSLEILAQSLSTWSSSNCLVMPLQQALRLCMNLLEAMQRLQRIQQMQAIVLQLTQESSENLKAALNEFSGSRPLREAVQEAVLSSTRMASRTTNREEYMLIATAEEVDLREKGKPDRPFVPQFRPALPIGEDYGSGRAASQQGS